MHRIVTRLHRVAHRIGVNALLLLPVLMLIFTPKASAGPQVLDRFLMLDNSAPAASAQQRIGFRYTNFTSLVGSVSLEYCANSPLPQLVCVPPTGLDARNASLNSQSGQTGFSINLLASTANKIVITRGPQAPSASQADSEYIFTDIQNPSSSGSYYLRIQTYSTVDATGVAIEEGGVVFTIQEQFNVAAIVPPNLLMCAAVTITAFDCGSATSFFIDLGEFSRTSPTAVTSQLLAATNAGFGFSVTLAGTTLVSGNNLIPPLLTQAPSVPGTGQFGLNLRANSSPGIGANPIGPGVASVAGDYGVANRYKFVPGDTVVSSNGTTDFRKFTVSYVTNVGAAQPPGVYATTVTFIALANF